MANREYRFGRTSFKNFVWVKQGQLFSDVESMDIESMNRVKYRVELVNSRGQVFRYFKIDPTPPRGLWSSVSLDQHFGSGQWPARPPQTWQEAEKRKRMSSGPCKIRLVNEGTGTCKLVQGYVHF